MKAHVSRGEKVMKKRAELDLAEKEGTAEASVCRRERRVRVMLCSMGQR